MKLLGYILKNFILTNWKINEIEEAMKRLSIKKSPGPDSPSNFTLPLQKN
jgi:hypothetical protein